MTPPTKLDYGVGVNSVKVLPALALAKTFGYNVASNTEDVLKVSDDAKVTRTGCSAFSRAA